MMTYTEHRFHLHHDNKQEHIKLDQSPQNLHHLSTGILYEQINIHPFYHSCVPYI